MMIVERLGRARATDALIEELESELNHRLPESYRRFLAEINGGRPEPACFSIQTPAGSTDSVVDWFLTLDPGEKLYTIRKYRKMYEDRIPAGLIPIACDPFGNLILLDVSAREFGIIYFWDHEKESMDEPTWGNVSLVAPSFAAFERDLH